MTFIFHFSPETESGQKAEGKGKAHQSPSFTLCGVCGMIFSGCDYFQLMYCLCPRLQAPGVIHK